MRLIGSIFFGMLAVLCFGCSNDVTTPTPEPAPVEGIDDDTPAKPINDAGDRNGGENEDETGHQTEDAADNGDAPTTSEGPRRVFQEGVDHLKESEGFEPVAYEDVADYCTIAYGHLIRKSPCAPEPLPLEFQGILSEADGEALLRSDMEIAESAVDGAVIVALDDHQYAALVSFVYNVGGGNFRDSTLLRLLNDGDYISVATQLRRWIFAGGQAVTGLQNRREREIELFFTNIELPQTVMMSLKSAQSPIDIITGQEIAGIVLAPTDEQLELGPSAEVNLSDFQPRPKVDIEALPQRAFIVKPNANVRPVLPVDRRTVRLVPNTRLMPKARQLPTLEQPIKVQPQTKQEE